MFKVVKCSNCGLFQVSGATKSLKCLKCGRTRVLSSLKVYFRSADARECQQVLAGLKEEEFMGKEGAHDDFFNYKL